MYGTSNILDTLRMDANGFFLKELHARRTFETYQSIGVDKFSFESVLSLYGEIEGQLLTDSIPKKIRIVFDRTNLLATTTVEDLIPVSSTALLEVMKTEQKSGVGPSNFKWQNRNFWDTHLARKLAQADDIISVNTENFVTETSRYNLFLYSKESDAVVTPPLSSGCINGVYRRYVLEKKLINLPGLGPKSIHEKLVHTDQLFQYKIFLGNSVRDVLAGKLI